MCADDLVTRRAAINFYRHCPGAAGAELMGKALTNHLHLFENQQVPGARRDLAYELRECIEVQLPRAAVPGLAAVVKSELLAGRGTTGFVLWAGAREPAWLAQNAANLLAKNVASAGRLRRVVAHAPEAIRQEMERSLGG